MGNLELFFDLVFVYAMAQLTELVRDDVSWRGFGHGVLGLLAVWWAWVCYTWLTNTFTTNRVVFRCLVIAAMAAMLLAASALPTAFSTGALVFGLALLAIRVIHLVLFVVDASHNDEHLRAGLLRLAPSLLIAPVLIAGAAAFPAPYRELLWIGAAIIDFGGPLVAGVAFFGFGASVALEHVFDPLPLLPAIALSGGVGLFYAADVAYRWRDHHQLVPDRLLTAAASLLIIPPALIMPAWSVLTVLTAVGALRLTCELVRRPRIGPAAAGQVH